MPRALPNEVVAAGSTAESRAEPSPVPHRLLLGESVLATLTPSAAVRII
jgi:hypothetical protein